MGRSKPLLVHEGRPLVRRIALAAREGGCDPILVVVGCGAADVRAALDGAGVSCVENPAFGEGLSSSIRRGVEALPESADAVLLLLCDQLAVTAALVARLVREFRESGRSMAACAYAGTLGPPAIFSRRHFAELLALRGDAGARKLLLASPADVATLPFPEGALDVDTPEDWRRFQEREGPASPAGSRGVAWRAPEVPMGFPDYAEHDAIALAERIRRREISAAEVLEAAILRVERWNPSLNAVVHEAYDEARRTAAGALPEGPLAGVPFLVKDLNLDVAGWPRTDGSVALRDRVPVTDSELVRRQRAAGLVLFGKTNTPEFGITGTTEGRLFGPCRNPWNPEHIAGGSSGGAAAAVASGMVPMAHASDGLGSIRIPASCCGLFGLKISRDRNPWQPEDVMRALPLSVHHCVSRTVRDSAALLDATGYAEKRAPWAVPPKERPFLEEVGRDPGRLRVAFSTERPDGKPLHAEVKAAVLDTAKLLESLGHVVEERPLPLNQALLYIAYAPAGSADSAARVAEMQERLGRELREEELEPLTWSIVRRGRTVTGEQLMRGLRLLQKLVRDVASLFEEFDVFLTPVKGTPPPKIGHIDPLAPDPSVLNQRQAESFPFTAPFNMSGQPAMSVPLAWSSDGLPLGMQFAARYGDEATLFRLAGQLEAARPWISRRPPIFG